MAFDHSHVKFQKLLDANVKFIGKQSLVNYQNIKKDPALLESYLSGLSNVTKNDFNNWNGNKKLSFLINAYNAFTIKLIVDNYPVTSIKDLTSFFSSPWEKDFFTLLDAKRNLDWIEHKKIRKEFKEPRIHFAVVCASISCPNLQKKVFTHTKLQDQLELATVEFLNDTKKTYIEKNKLYISKIFDWYEDDFVDVKKFVLTRVLTTTEIKSIGHLGYDWKLNEWK